MSLHSTLVSSSLSLGLCLHHTLTKPSPDLDLDFLLRICATGSKWPFGHSALGACQIVINESAASDLATSGLCALVLKMLSTATSCSLAKSLYLFLLLLKSLELYLLDYR